MRKVSRDDKDVRAFYIAILMLASSAFTAGPAAVFCQSTPHPCMFDKAEDAVQDTAREELKLSVVQDVKIISSPRASPTLDLQPSIMNRGEQQMTF